LILFSHFYVDKINSMNNSQASIEEIKQAFIKSCISFDATPFEPFLYSDKFVCNEDWKKYFCLLKRMLATSRANSVG